MSEIFYGTKVKAFGRDIICCFGGGKLNFHKYWGFGGQNKLDKSDSFTCLGGNDVKLFHDDGIRWCSEDRKNESGIILENIPKLKVATLFSFLILKFLACTLYRIIYVVIPWKWCCSLWIGYLFHFLAYIMGKHWCNWMQMI